jgi:hypothetical protein
VPHGAVFDTHTFAALAPPPDIAIIIATINPICFFIVFSFCYKKTTIVYLVVGAFKQSEELRGLFNLFATLQPSLEIIVVSDTSGGFESPTTEHLLSPVFYEIVRRK